MPTTAAHPITTLEDDHLHVLIDTISAASADPSVARQAAASYDTDDDTDPKATARGWTALLDEAHNFFESALSGSEAVTAGAYTAPGSSKQRWAVTALAHPGLADYAQPCVECLDRVNNAITMARVTGSTGATDTIRKADGEEHSATVARVLAIRVR